MNFSVTKNGKKLSKELYTWDEKTKTFSTTEDDLVLDFPNISAVTFKTGNTCIFKTGNTCIFKTGNTCVFITGHSCTFKTGFYCAFDTRHGCTFITGYACTFNTDEGCTFNTTSICTFNTSYGCTFDTSFDCTFKTGAECVVIRRDVFEVIQLKENQKIKLNDYNVIGFMIIPQTKTITIDNKNIEISIESFEQLKQQLID